MGPGGGNIFYVDSLGQFSDFDYLELAPVGWGNGIAVDSAGGETTGTSSVDPNMAWCSRGQQTTLIGITGNSTWALGAGATNTATADITCTGAAIQAASNYAGGSKDDWYLPSAGEASLLYTNMRQFGIGSMPLNLYWTSSEKLGSYSLAHNFGTGAQVTTSKGDILFVRPIRKF